MTATPAWLASAEAVFNRNIAMSGQAAALAKRLEGRSLQIEVDGITESEDPAGNQFGTTEIARDLAAPDPINAVFTSMHRFSGGAQPFDDCTMLVIDTATWPTRTS